MCHGSAVRQASTDDIWTSGCTFGYSLCNVQCKMCTLCIMCIVAIGVFRGLKDESSSAHFISTPSTPYHLFFYLFVIYHLFLYMSFALYFFNIYDFSVIILWGPSYWKLLTEYKICTTNIPRDVLKFAIQTFDTICITNIPRYVLVFLRYKHLL